MALQDRRKEVDGTMDRLIPAYMKSFIAWNQAQGKALYADANSTLRVTYGNVASNKLRDGIVKGPFTTVEGILEKYQGKDPFDAPAALLTAIRKKQYGIFKDRILGTVPVDFLSTAIPRAAIPDPHS